MNNGRTMSINNTHTLDIVNHGDVIQHEIQDGNTDYWFGKIYLKHHGVDVISEVGFETKENFELMDVMERVDGKLRLDLLVYSLVKWVKN